QEAPFRIEPHSNHRWSRERRIVVSRQWAGGVGRRKADGGRPAPESDRRGLPGSKPLPASDGGIALGNVSEIELVPIETVRFEGKVRVSDVQDRFARVVGE